MFSFFISWKKKKKKKQPNSSNDKNPLKYEICKYRFVLDKLQKRIPTIMWQKKVASEEESRFKTVKRLETSTCR